MTAVYSGLIGWPVAHSLSPVIHHYWRAQHGIAGDYTLFPINPERFDDDVKTLQRQNLRGFNVTVPYKERILAQLDTIDPVAQHIGAVNTVVRDGTTWRGTNTDAYGFITHLQASATALDLSRVVLLGAGGAARAAIVALQETGAGELMLINRTAETAAALAAEFGCKTGDWEARNDALDGATLLVNTTSLGMTGKPPLTLALDALAPQAVVYDIVYAPLETALLKQAKITGRQPVDGLGMLLYQAQKAFEEWHGILPVVDDTLRQHVLAELAAREQA